MKSGSHWIEHNLTKFQLLELEQAAKVVEMTQTELVTALLLRGIAEILQREKEHNENH